MTREKMTLRIGEKSLMYYSTVHSKQCGSAPPHGEYHTLSTRFALGSTEHRCYLN